MAEKETKPVEETPEEKKEEPEKKEEEEGEASPSSMIDAANDAAARIERANAKAESLLVRGEQQKVKDMLGGKADAGKPAVEETPEEYAKKVMANDTETKD